MLFRSILENNSQIDVIVKDAGELIFKMLLETDLSPKGFSTVPGISYRDNDKVLNSQGIVKQQDLNLVPSPYQTKAIDLEDGNNFTATVSTSTVTWTFSNPTASDELCGFTLFLTNGGSQTVNWPASVDWAGGTAPTLTTSGLDILVFVTTNGGTTWHGMVGSADSK